jgi:poly-gamma-glutamate synthesis protein (capsule biosynthesis protein)
LALALKDAGVDVAALANNHCCDAGGRGIASTVDILEETKIMHTGAFKDSVDYLANNILYLERCGIRFALLNYTYGTNGIPTPKGRIVNRLDTVLMARDIESISREEVDFIMAFVHWGNEYEILPSKHQRKLAEVMKSAGVDLIIGSHPHVVQPMEVDFAVNSGRGVATVYSLGNFISNQNDVNSRGGAMAKVLMSRYDDRPVLLGVKPSLFFCQKPIRGKDNYVVVPQELKDSVRADSKAVFQSFMRNAENLFEKYNKNID